MSKNSHVEAGENAPVTTANTAVDEVEFITAAEAAGILGETRRHTVRRAESGQLTYAQKLPGRTGAYLFRPTDVRALKAKLSTAAT